MDPQDATPYDCPDPPELFSVYYFSSPELGNIKECECHLVDFETARKWFEHHTTNVAARMGLTVRVIVVDNLDQIVAEWISGRRQ